MLRTKRKGIMTSNIQTDNTHWKSFAFDSIEGHTLQIGVLVFHIDVEEIRLQCILISILKRIHNSNRILISISNTYNC